MADIPAANITEALHISMGTLKGWKAKVKGDGTGVTISVPFARVEACWTGNIDDSSAIPAISASSGVLTYASAPTINKYHYLFVVGY